MTTQSRSLALASQLSRQPFSLPGGCPLYAVADDGGSLCYQCCRDERLAIATTTGADGWCIHAIVVNWEEPDLFCDHCGDRIEFAYGEL